VEEPAAYIAIAEKRLLDFTTQRTLIPVNTKASDVYGIVENAFEKKPLKPDQRLEFTFPSPFPSAAKHECWANKLKSIS
jgi:hypothetical protein